MENSLYTFFMGCKKVTFKKGQTILHPNTIPRGFFFIETGYVKVYTLTHLGEEKIHCFYKPKNIFPLQWLCKDIKLTNYYDAMTDVTLHLITKEELFDHLESHKEDFYILIDELCYLLDTYSDRIADLQYISPHERLISRLVYLAKRFGTQQQKDIIINAPITYKDIANSINTSRETVNKEFKMLEQQGLISYSRNQIIVHDIETLLQELSSYKIK